MSQRLATVPAPKLKALLQQCERRRAAGDQDVDVLTWLEGLALALLAQDFGVHVRMSLERRLRPEREVEAGSAAAAGAGPRGESDSVGPLNVNADDEDDDVQIIGERPALLRAPSWGLGSCAVPTQTLRISAGRASVAAGIHPYADVGEFFLELLYQDLPELLLKDCALVGAELVSTVDERARLFDQSGQAAALQAALRAGAASEGLEGVQAARAKMLEAVGSAERGGRLSVKDAEMLRNDLDMELNVEFGARHEDAALLAYEASVGQPCYGAQQRIRVALPRAGPEEALATVFPSPGSGSRASSAGHGLSPSSGSSPAGGGVPATSGASTPVKSGEAYFYLTGFIDGLVDVPRGGGARGLGAEGLETLVVEVKHRMNRIQEVPNIYDVVQLCCYCRVLGCERGDLVQCLRKASPSHPGAPGSFLTHGKGKASAGTLHVERLDFSEGSQHRTGWDKHVLPGMYKVAAAVYAARADRDLRLQLLMLPPEGRAQLVGSLVPHLAK